MGMLTAIISILIVGALIVFFIFRKKWMHKLTLTGIVTILGGFGTFLGIFIGLVKLDILDLGERKTPSLKELIQGNLHALIPISVLLGILLAVYLLRKLRKSNWLEKHPIPVNLKLLGMGVLATVLAVFIGLVNLDIIHLGISISSLKEIIQTNLPTFVLVIVIVTTFSVLYLVRKLRKSKWLEKHPIPVKLKLVVVVGIFLALFIGLVSVDIDTLEKGILSFQEQIETNVGTMISVVLILSVITGLYFLRKLRKSEWLETHPIPVNLKVLELSGIVLAIFIGLVTLGVIDIGASVSSFREKIPINIPNLITTVLILSMFGVIILLRKSEIGKDTIPAVVTILGILGTFSGIFIGLLSFDARNIQESVPQLLDGIKTAFITSIAGISLAIFFRVRNSLRLQHQQGQGEDEETVTLETLAKLMTYQQMMTESGLREIVSSLSGKKAGTPLSHEGQQSRVSEHRQAAERLLNELRVSKAEESLASTKDDN